MSDALLKHVALVSESDSIGLGEVSKVSAALQKQVARDVSPIWGIQATVDAFEKLEDVPPGYWPMVIRDNIGYDAAGIHLDKDGQPFALITSGDNWSLTASHENLEMLVDPFGNRVMAGDSPKPDQGRVEFLVEVCDPSEASQFAYSVNGILVSDFYTPHFFDPVASKTQRYSFTGAIKEPRTVLQGGYLSWHDLESDEWWQETWFGGSQPGFRNIGRMDGSQGSLRAQIDRITGEETYQAMHAEQSKKSAYVGLVTCAQMKASRDSKATRWHNRFAEVIEESPRAKPAKESKRRPTPGT